MAEKTSQEEPRALEDGHQEAASGAPEEQETELFDRILRGLVSRQETFEATDGAEALAQGAEITGSVERRCERPCSGDRPATRRRPRAAAIPQRQARKAPDPDSRQGLPEAGCTKAVSGVRSPRLGSTQGQADRARSQQLAVKARILHSTLVD